MEMTLHPSCRLSLFVVGLLSWQSAQCAAIAECARLADPNQRLACFDAATRSAVAVDPVQAPSPVAATIAPPAERREEPCDTRFDARRPVVRSPLAWRWDLDRCEKVRSVLLPHQLNYLLPLALDRSVNRDSGGYSDIAREREGFKHSEAKFQLSLKLRIWKDLFWGRADLWGAYTQRSFWQVYSREVSSPFRESNYEPELILAFNTPWRWGALRGRMFNVGFDHQSNGRSDVLSRSWNRVYVEAGVDGDHYLLTIRPWWRINDGARTDDNPGIENWIGRVQINGAWQWQEHVFSLQLRNNLLWHNNRGSVQLGWTHPLTDRIKSYVQLFDGYGESLIDYRHRSTSLGIGILLGDWL